MRFRPSILLLFPAALLFFCAAFRLPAPSRPAPEYGSAVCNTVRAMLQDDTQEAVPPRMQPGRAEAGRRGGTPIPPALLPPVPVPLPRAEAVPPETAFRSMPSMPGSLRPGICGSGPDPHSNELPFSIPMTEAVSIRKPLPRSRVHIVS